MTTLCAVQRHGFLRRALLRWGGAVSLVLVAATAFGQVGKGQARQAAAAPGQCTPPTNLVVRIPHTWLATELDRSWHEDFLVNDVIVGTRVTGVGQLTGTLTSHVRPGVGRGILDLSFRGQLTTSTHGCVRRAGVWSTGVTQLQGTKRAVIDAEGIRLLPARVSGDTHITYDTVRAPRARLTRRAGRQVCRSRAQAERESAVKAAVSVGAKLDEAADRAASAFNHTWQNQIVRPLAARDLWPQTHSIHSDRSGLTLSMLLRTSHHLGASVPPPASHATSAPEVLVHASFAQQMLTQSVRGQTVTGEQLSRWLHASDRSGTSAVPTEDWSLSFSDSAPIDVTFQDDAAHVTLRLAGFHAQGREFPAMEISVLYRFRQVGDHVVLQRAGAIQIDPLGFVRGQQRLSGPQLATRDVLRRKLEATVPHQLDLRQLLSPNQDMPWRITRFSIDRGWLCLGLGLASVEPRKPLVR